MSTISDIPSFIPPTIRDTVIQTLLPHGVSQILVFGSYATGKSTPESDLDLIVSFHSRKDLFDMGEMREDLIEALGIQVDLLSEGAISPYLKDKIKNEAVVIYSEE
ncbi:MAG TPA: nucleotidyltransferase family protein [Methanospirillum sp.]|nr:nucleotidyltransferase family protein [Methanospirillum sp.]